MEIVIIVCVGIAVIGWWIWREGHLEKKGHPLEKITQPTESVVVEAVSVSSEITADRTVETETVTTKKPVKKPAKPKSTTTIQPKKPATKKSPAKITAKPKKPKTK